MHDDIEDKSGDLDKILNKDETFVINKSTTKLAENTRILAELQKDKLELQSSIKVMRKEYDKITDDLENV